MTLSRFVALARALGLPSPFALGRPPGAEQNAHVADTPSEIELLRLWRDLPAGERERLVRIIEAFGASRQQDVA